MITSNTKNIFMNIRNFLILPFWALLILSLNAQSSVGEFVQFVGEQNILAQQIARFYMASDLSVAAGTNQDLYKEHLRKYIRNMDKMQELELPETTDASKEQLMEVYDQFHRLLSESLEGPEVIKLLKVSRSVLLKTDALLFALEHHAEEKEQVDMFALHQLSMMLRKAALSQHAVLYYLARWNEVETSLIFVDLNETILSCEDIFRQLTENAVGYPDIENSLVNKAYQWAIAEPILTGLKDDLRRRDLRQILGAAEILYHEGMSIAANYMKMVKANAASND
jgi:hypothetical protein